MFNRQQQTLEVTGEQPTADRTQIRHISLRRKWARFAAATAFSGFVALSGAALSSTAALAQANPISPPTRDELAPPQAQPEERRTSTLTIDGEMARTPCALDNPQLQDIRVTLTQVSFVGAEAATGIDLSSAYNAYLGRDLPISVLCDIRAQATAILTGAGYLAAVEIPEQTLTEGAAEFRVVMGRLTALRVRGDAGPSEKLLASYLQRLVGNEAFNTRDAERYLLLAGDIPGLDVRLALRPAAGGAPGDLIGEVAVVRRTAAVDLNVQNYGSSALGRFGGLLRAQLFDLTGMGDRTTIALFSSHDFDEQQTLQLGHDFFAGSDGLSLGGSLTLGWTNPSLGIANFDVKSKTIYGNVHASYPFVRTQKQSIYGTVGLDVVNQDVNANGLNLSRDRVRTAYVRLGLEQTDINSVARRGGYTPFEPRVRVAANLELRQGLGILGANQDCRTNPAPCITANQLPSRVEQDPTPLLLRGEIHTELRPAPLLAFVFDIEAQYTRDALPAFEEYSGGNYSIGRGYNPGAVTGDTGIGTRAEIRYGSLVPASLDSFALQPYVFIDHATVRDRDPSQRPFNPDRLLSVGTGLRFTQGRGLQGDLTIAVPLERTDLQTTRGDVRILFSLTGRLLPWRF